MKLLLLDRPSDKTIIKNREVEFFGPWAQPIETPEDLTEPAFEPYPTPESIYDVGIEVIDMVHGLLTRLIAIMPGLTGVNRGERFWRLLFGHHILAVAGIVQDIMLRHKALPEKDYILGLAYENDYVKEHIPYSWADAQELIFYNDCFRWYAMGLYLKNHYRNHEPIRYSETPPRTIARRTERLLTKVSQDGLGWLFQKAASVLPGHGTSWSKEGGIREDACSLVWDRYQSGDVDFEKLGATVLAQESLPSITSLPSFQVDGDKRTRIKDALPQPYGELLSLSLPVIAVEGLLHLVNLMTAEKLPGFKEVERIYTYGQGFADEGPKRVLLALLADEGKKLISVQHGSGASSPPEMYLEKVIADEYISWGPGHSDSDNRLHTNITRFLPSTYLTNLEQKGIVREKRKWEILLVVSEGYRHVRWHYSPLPPDMAHDCFTRQKVLFDYFCVKKKAAVKITPEAYGWGQADWLRTKYPAARLLASGRFVDYAFRSRIAIVDYNSTAFLEMLAMGRPFLATWSRRWFKGNGLFEEFIDKLIEVGVFYEQPEALIESYTEVISSDVELWWNERKRQDVLKGMANNFALTSNNVYEEWSAEFQRS